MSFKLEKPIYAGSPINYEGDLKFIYQAPSIIEETATITIYPSYPTDGQIQSRLNALLLKEFSSSGDGDVTARVKSHHHHNEANMKVSIGQSRIRKYGFLPESFKLVTYSPKAEVVSPGYFTYGSASIDYHQTSGFMSVSFKLSAPNSLSSEVFSSQSITKTWSRF